MTVVQLPGQNSALVTFPLKSSGLICNGRLLAASSVTGRLLCADSPPAAEAPSGGTCGYATGSPDLGTPRRYAFRTPARALVRLWAPASMFHAESPRLVGWVDYTIEHVFGCRERCRR